MRRLVLCVALLLALIVAPPARSADVPDLRAWSQNQGGADLLPNGRVLVVVELRATEYQTATLSLGTPLGFTVTSVGVSSGAYAVPDMFPRETPPPFVRWTGEVSSTQPITLFVLYTVLPGAAPGDRKLIVSGLAGGVPIATALFVRVCCVAQPTPEPPPVPMASSHRVYLPTLRGGPAPPVVLPAASVPVHGTDLAVGQEQAPGSQCENRALFNDLLFICSSVAHLSLPRSIEAEQCGAIACKTRCVNSNCTSPIHEPCTAESLLSGVALSRPPFGHIANTR